MINTDFIKPAPETPVFKIYKTICLSFITDSISFTVTETKLFKPIREWIKRKNTFLGELISCGYCFGHWVTIALVAAYRLK
ncbi:MAG: DUF1360 domain-containing protein [Candidatus Brocadia sp.]|nr:MAG: DUF1360 domain-containing protein [Candidatus Brocadia sp.]